MCDKFLRKTKKIKKTVFLRDNNQILSTHELNVTLEFFFCY